MEKETAEQQGKHPLDELSDEQLLIYYGDGSQIAGDILIRRYAQVIRACARPYFLSGGDSEDLTQEGMIGLLSALHEYRPDLSSFKTFAVLCIRRSIISAVRTSQTKGNDVLNTSLSIEQMFDEKGIEIQASAQNPESLVISRDERTRMRKKFFSKLSEFEQRVLTLYLDGFSYSDMAVKLNCPRKSIDNAVQRIRHKLTE